MSAPQRTHADWSHYPPAQLPRVVSLPEDVYDEEPFPERPWPQWLRVACWAGVLVAGAACWLVVIGLFALIARALYEIARVKGW